MKQIDPILQKGTWINGTAKLTYADFVVGGLYTNMINNKGVGFEAERWAKAKEQYAAFTAYGEKFSAENKDYLESRKQCGM